MNGSKKKGPPKIVGTQRNEVKLSVEIFGEKETLAKVGDNGDQPLT